MKKYVIVSDSCCDLDAELRQKYDVEYVPMHFSVDGKEYVADLDWKDLSVKDFYDLMRQGKRIKTAQVNAAEYRVAFEKYLSKGYDILSISCSSALSHSVKESYIVRDELKEKYPDKKIICIDTLNSCGGLGNICVRASELRAEGKDIEEVAKWIEENKLSVNQECTVGSLTYLKQAGRVSAASAFFGGLLSVKPIIISDALGQNVAVEKVKGRKNSFLKIAERFKNEYTPCDYQRITIVHADCEEEALEVKELILNQLPEKIDVNLAYIGPIVGASVGPGTIGVYFYGKPVELNAK